MAKKDEGMINVAEETRKILNAEEKVKVYLHEEQYKSKSKSVTINGVLFVIPVGEWTEVPKSIAALLEDSKAVIAKSKKETEVYKKGLGKDMSGSI